MNGSTRIAEVPQDESPEQELAVNLQLIKSAPELFDGAENILLEFPSAIVYAGQKLTTLQAAALNKAIKLFVFVRSEIRLAAL